MTTLGGKKKRKPKDTRMVDWALAVRARDGNKCRYCGRTDTLNTHHIYSRSRKATRYDVDNGITLCVAHHTLSSAFSAHKTPVEFIDWLREQNGEEWLESLRRKAKHIDD